MAVLAIAGLLLLASQVALGEDLSVSFSPASMDIKSGEQATMTIAVKYTTNQTPVKGAEILYVVSADSGFKQSGPPKTDDSGNAVATITGTKAGQYPFTVNARLGNYSGSTRATIKVAEGGGKTSDISTVPPTPVPPTPAPPTPAPTSAQLKPSAEKSTIEVPSAPVNVSAPAQIKVVVRDDSGKPVPDANVVLGAEKVKGSLQTGTMAIAMLLQAEGGQTISPASGRTGPDGSFTATFTSPSPGEYRITANVGGISFSSPASLRVLAAAVPPVPGNAVKPPSLPGGLPVSMPSGTVPILMAAISAILLAFLVLWFIGTRNHMRLIPKRQAVTADGTSVVPIRIQFVNGFGKPRRQKHGREIEMQSTAGEISNVTLPPGRESVEAPLKSSTDCGKVTVTARAGSKVASTDLEFVCSETGLDIEAKPETIPADGRSSANINISIKDNKGGHIVSTVDRQIDITTTLGTVDSPVVIPAGLTTATSRLHSGKAGGTAIITATSGKAKGQARVAIGELEKRFCMHCGSRMSMEDAVCEKCGNAPPSGTDTKLCANCKTILPEAARFCYKCGAGQPELKSQ